MESGYALQASTGTDPNRTSFSYVAKQLGGPVNATAQQEVDFLRTVDAGLIESFLQDHGDRSLTPVLYFGPTADNKTAFLPQDYVAKGRAADYANLHDLESHSMPTCHDQYREVSKRLTYRYLYAGNFTNISPLPWMGAYHTAEVPLITGTYGDYRGVAPLEQEQLSGVMQDLWLAFAKDAQNGLVDSEWKPYSADGDVIVFGREGILTGQESVLQLDSGCPS
ncbi:MAG: hypothetical protein Q9202_002016 [Teloschistes flavicans]